MAFERPAEFIGKEPEIAGSELTNPEAAKVFSRVLGKPVKFQKLPCSSSASFWVKSFTPCSAGSTKRDSKRTFPVFAPRTPRFIFILSRSGCAKKDGTNPPYTCALRKATNGKESDAGQKYLREGKRGPNTCF